MTSSASANPERGPSSPPDGRPGNDPRGSRARKGLNPETPFWPPMPKKAARKKAGKKSTKKKAYYSGRKERRAKK